MGDGGRPERGGMFAADNGFVRIVIELDELLAPAEPEGLARGEHNPHGGLQALRPCLNRAKRRGGPVERAHANTHLTAAPEEVGGLCRVPVINLIVHIEGFC